MRDNFKDKDYFDELLKTLYASQNKRLEKFKENRIKEDRVNNVKRAMATNYRRILVAKYSRGDNMFLPETLDDYKNCLELLYDSWEENDNNFKYIKNKQVYILNQYPFSGYLAMLELFSLGVLLDTTEENFSMMVEILNKDNVKDFLFEFLIRFYKEKRPQINEESYQEYFHINERLGRLKVIIKETNKNQAEKELKHFLEKEWYPSFKDTPLYDQHLNPHNTYVGYWCFVAAAIVKIMDLDDSSFRDNPYYPKDLL